MATQTITVFDRDADIVLHKAAVKFRTIADACDDMNAVVTSMLLSPFDFGGAFGNPRAVVLHTERYEIDLVVTR